MKAQDLYTTTTLLYSPQNPNKRHINVRPYSATHLFNRLQQPESLLLMDVRQGLERRSQGFITQSISLPPLQRQSSTESTNWISLIEQGLDEEDLVFFRKRKLKEIIIYGGSEFDTQWIEMLTEILVSEASVWTIGILNVNFSEFKTQYTYMTSLPSLPSVQPHVAVARINRTESGNHHVTYPNEICQGTLYMGNMWQALSRDVMRDMKITHIVNASLDCDNAHVASGVQYMNVRVKDKKNSDITPYFPLFYAFMCDALQENPDARILVHCTQGVSRSATLVLSYLMKSKRWTLVQSVNCLLSKRGVVYPNRGFVAQLMRFEHTLYGVCSISDVEMDALVDGRIPDTTVSEILQNRTLCERCCIS